MITAFQVMLLIIMFLSIIMMFSKEFDKDTKLQTTAFGVVSIFGFIVTLIWL
jgi:hypothetical protein